MPQDSSRAIDFPDLVKNLIVQNSIVFDVLPVVFLLICTSLQLFPLHVIWVFLPCPFIMAATIHGLRVENHTSLLWIFDFMVEVILTFNSTIKLQKFIYVVGFIGIFGFSYLVLEHLSISSYRAIPVFFLYCAWFFAFCHHLFKLEKELKWRQRVHKFKDFDDIFI